MSEILLLEALRRRCYEATKDLRQPTKDKALPLIAPNVLNGFFVPEQKGAFAQQKVNEISPFIIVRPYRGGDQENNTLRVTTEIIIQIFNDSNEFTGDVDLLLCMNRIRDNIKQNPILETTYIYDGGLKWEIPPEQPHPNWEMSVKMNWLIPNMQRQDLSQYI